MAKPGFPDVWKTERCLRNRLICLMISDKNSVKADIMGQYGGKNTTGSYRKLDVRLMQRKGALRSGVHSVLTLVAR